MESPSRIDAIIDSFRTVSHAVQRATVAHWLDLELSMAQLKALLAIARAASASIGEVAEALGVGLPAASHLVERLVQDGLVERAADAADRRRTLAALTPSGELLVTQLRQGSAARLREWLAQLDAAELAHLERSLGALADIARADGAALADADLRGDAHGG